MSPHIRYCVDFGRLLRCSNLKTGVVFTFLEMAVFLITFLLPFAAQDAANAAKDGAQEHCVAEMTPNNQNNNDLSPISNCL